MKRRRSEAQLQALADGRDRLRLARVYPHLHPTATPSAKGLLTQLLAGDMDDIRLQSHLRVHLPSFVYISEGSDIFKMCRALLSEGLPTSSLRVQAILSNVDFRAAVRYQRICAELVLSLDRERRSRMEQCFATASLERVQYLDIDMADETPMLVGVRDLLDNSLGGGAVTESSTPAGSGHALAFMVAPTKSKTQVVASPAKILQARSGVSMFTRDPSTKKFFALRGETINSLSHLERTTAECLVAAWERRTAVTQSSWGAI